MYPTRIVCTAAEVPEILDALGAFDCIVGVSGFSRRPPKVRTLPKVGGFSTVDIEKITILNPDLVITTSNIQAELAAECIRHGIPVLALNPHRLTDVWSTILQIGGVVGRQQAAEDLVAKIQTDLHKIQTSAEALPRHPRIYFEEWHDPPISGIGWVSDLIELAGGVDIFPNLREQYLAQNRVVSFEDVAERQPEIIIASWCGKKADLKAISSRQAFTNVPAVQAGSIYEIKSELVLQTGLSLVQGAHQLHTLIKDST